MARRTLARYFSAKTSIAASPAPVGHPIDLAQVLLHVGLH